LLLALTLSASIRRHDRRAGIWLALVAALKPTTLSFVLWFLWKRSFSAAATFAALSAALICASVAVLGVGTAGDFVLVAQYFSGPTFSVTPINQSPYGLLLRLFTTNPFTQPLVVAIAVDVGRFLLASLMVLTLAMAIWRRRNLPARQSVLEYGLLTVGMLVVAPLAEDIHNVYLLIPFAAVGAALPSTWQLKPVAVALTAVLVADY
jgi:hypothetical protein